MGKVCTLKNCRRNTCDNKPISFFRIPKTSNIRQAWLDFIQITENQVNTNCILCDIHFEEKYFKKKNPRALLQEDAIPTLFPLPSHMQKSVKVKTEINFAENEMIVIPIDPVEYGNLRKDENITSPAAAKPKRKYTRKNLNNSDQQTPINTEKTSTNSIISTTKLSIKRPRKMTRKSTQNIPTSSQSNTETSVLLNDSNKEGSIKKNVPESTETRLNLAEFRIAQYQIAVEHLQSRLEACITELTQLKEKHQKEIEHYMEELDSRNCKIIQLEVENATLMENVSKRIIKVEESEQSNLKLEDKILGY